MAASFLKFIKKYTFLCRKLHAQPVYQVVKNFQTLSTKRSWTRLTSTYFTGSNSGNGEPKKKLTVVPPHSATAGYHSVGVSLNLKTNVYSCVVETLIFYQQVRYKKKKNKQHGVSDDDIDTDDDEFNEGKYIEEDKDFNPKFKDKTAHVKSTRADAILSSGLDISRNKIEDYFLGSKMFLNGKKLLKKSQQMNVGEYIDLLTGYNEAGDMRVKRVRLLSIGDDKTSKDKIKVKLRTWKDNTNIQTVDEPQDEH